MRATLLVVFLVVGCVDPSGATEPDGCSPDLLEEEGATPVDVGAFALERDYQRIDGTFTDEVDSYAFGIDREDGVYSHRVRAMVAPIWSAMVRARVTCRSGADPAHCGGSSHLYDGACEAWALDLANVTADCDGPADVVVDVSPSGARDEVCSYALDVAVTP